MAAHGNHGNALPDGWLIRVSRSKGKVYYYNTHTKQTQWVRPTETAVAAGGGGGEKEDERGVTRKRQRTEDERPDQSADTNDTGDDVAVREEVPDSDATTTTSKTRAMIAMCMRVGGSAFVARQNHFGTVSSTTGSKPRGAFTPWDHQLEAIENVILEIQAQDGDAKAKAHVDRFLLQHSTGAGKTMTIAALVRSFLSFACATYQLLYAVDACGARFHTVVILIDRVKLDEQVGNTVESFLRRNGIHEVFRAESMSHLAALMDNSTTSSSETTTKQPHQRVIITTIHKMGLLVKDEVMLTRMLHRNSQSTDASATSQFSRIAIITDEAHRSHTASTRETIQKVMKAGDSSENAHISFVGFTATPNAEALHLFGTRSNDGVLRPFHCYPIAKATLDGRIMDVLKNYTCLRLDVETTIPNDVLDSLSGMHALRGVLDHASDDLAVLKAKAALMMQDFTDTRNENKSAKCMVVARNRRDVLRYHQLISVYATNRQLKWNIYAAFSGTLTLDEPGNATSVTEDTLNGSQLHLASSDIVIVCDKLDTGYNDPKLSCMYIDRYLRSSSQTVQLASRLNRQHKASLTLFCILDAADKPNAHILDFANHAAQIRRSFASFWEETRVQSNPDGLDLDAEMADAITGCTILCDYFPELWENPESVHVNQLVESQILPLERDAFHQVLDALRLYCSAFGRLQSAECESYTTRFPFRYEALVKLKKEVEARCRISGDSSTVDVEQVKSKMASRVSRYRKVFSGSIYPPSVLRQHGRPDGMVDELGLRGYGPLETFETLIHLTRSKEKVAAAKALLDSTKSLEARSDEPCNPVEYQRDRILNYFSIGDH